MTDKPALTLPEDVEEAVRDVVLNFADTASGVGIGVAGKELIETLRRAILSYGLLERADCIGDLLAHHLVKESETDRIRLRGKRLRAEAAALKES